MIVEIRAGAGGEEAALFATELLRMYSRYAQEHKFQTDLMSVNETGIGGTKEAILEVAGDENDSRLEPEAASIVAGVRRRRGPIRAARGPRGGDRDRPARGRRRRGRDRRGRRTCGSTSSAAPGPGGQSVNTTDSAVQITHLPTGLVVEIQDEKSQHKNKAKAMSVLRSRLYDMELAKQREAQSAERKVMVGGGDRSRKTRTYNFPDNRVTDHRIGVTIHNVPGVLEGQLDALIDALVMADQAERLSHLTGGDELQWGRRKVVAEPAANATQAERARTRPGTAGAPGDTLLRRRRPAGRQGHGPGLGPGAQAGQPVPALRPVRGRPSG